MSEDRLADKIDAVIEEQNQIAQKALIASAAPEPPKAKKSDIGSWFNANFIQLMQVSPSNPIVRGHIMARVKTMPPPELDTFDKLRDWIEQNFEFVKPVKPVRSSATFKVDFDVSEVQTGTCRYSVTTSGEWTERVTLEDILEKINEGDSAKEIIGWIEQCASENQAADLDPSDDYDYSDYEFQDAEGASVTRSGIYTRVESALFEFLDEYAPEYANNLRDRG